VAVLRIESADGSSSRFCKGPGAGVDWDFVDCDTDAAVPAGTITSCITINHDSSRETGCGEANPGETYIMQYLGLVPGPSSSNPEGGCTKAADELVTESQSCSSQLGGAPEDWQCFGAQADGGLTRGTCVCRTN
jgi:hypothetical protein